MIKALKKLGIEGKYLNIIKSIYDNPIAYIILSMIKSEELKSEIRKGCPLSLVLLNIILEFLARTVRQEK
jgi:hypothetical protein